MPSLSSFSFRKISAHRVLGLFLLILVAGCSGLANAKPKAPKNRVPLPAPISTAPHYYYTLDLDPRYQFVGTGELTEEAATGANCYRFFYNDSGKLKQIQYRRAGIPAPDPYLGVCNIDFEYLPGIERHWFHDAQGQAMSSRDGIVGEELTLNAAGFPIDVANLNAAGSKVRDNSGVIHYQRTLDSQNRLAIGKRIGLLGTAITDDNGYFETRTAYDGLSHAIERANFDSSGNPLNAKDGIATVRTNYTLYPDVTQSVASFFDATGMAIEEAATGVHEISRTFDRRGFLINESYFDVTGTPCLDSTNRIHERRYQFDERGNMISEAFYDTEGHPHDGWRKGYAKVTWKYDDRNRVVETAYFGDDGTAQIIPDVGAAVVRVEYDADGNVVHKQFFDGLGHPTISTLYGAAAIRYVIKGDRTYVQLRDSNDQQTKNPPGGFVMFSYKTATDKPITPGNTLASTNIYYNRYGKELTYFPRVSVINPHLYALRQSENAIMKYSARWGAIAAGAGALLACFLALRKASHTRRRKVYVPSPFERFLGWLAILAIMEGTLRFFLTVYWWWLDHQNGRMGQTIYVVEIIMLLFFAYRLFRMRITMRALNIEREDIHRLVRDFLTQEGFKPEWNAARHMYITPPLDVRIRFFQGKYHAYLAFHRRGDEGWDLAEKLPKYIRTHTIGIHAPLRSRTIKFYYRSVAFAYLLLSGTAFYTVYQLFKSY